MSFHANIDIKATAKAPDIDLDPNRLEFGKHFVPLWLTRAYADGAWQGAAIDRMDMITLHPAAITLHYGQSVFEGLKAHRWPDGSVNLFRPIENARRMNRSAERLAMPVMDEQFFVESIRQLVALQQDWVPEFPGFLYIRPTLIATEPCLGVRSSHDFLFFTLALPSGGYFPQTGGASAGSVRVYVTSSVGRAARGGTGHVKAAANYAVTVKVIADAKAKGCSQVLFLDACGARRIEEMGGMNVFFVSGKKLITPRTSGTILPGITRDSIIQIAPSLGYTVEERDINFDDLLKQIKAGEVTEAFACGTAAVIVGIESLLLDTGEEIKLNAPRTETERLYKHLTDIQFGQQPDPFGWIVKI